MQTRSFFILIWLFIIDMMLISGCTDASINGKENQINTIAPGPSIELTTTDTIKPSPKATENLTISAWGNPTLSYRLADNSTSIARNLKIIDLEIGADGIDGQIPCGHQAVLTFTDFSTNYPLTSIQVESFTSIKSITDEIFLKTGGVDYQITFIGDCPHNNLENIPYRINLNIETSNANLPIAIYGEFYKPFKLEDLILPYDVQEMAEAISQNDVHLEYKLETRPEDHERGPHLGDMIEIASDYQNTIFPENPVSIIAPIQMRIINLWGFDDRLICMNTFVGYDPSLKPIYFSIYHIDSLDHNLIENIAKVSQLPIESFKCSETGWGNKVIHPNVIIEKSEIIGYFDHFETRDYWGGHIASQLHINLTHTDPTDNLRPYEFALDFSQHYLSQIINTLMPAQSFRLIIDEGFNIEGKTFSETNPVPLESFHQYFSLDTEITRLDYRTALIKK